MRPPGSSFLDGLLNPHTGPRGATAVYFAGWEISAGSDRLRSALPIYAVLAGV